VILAFAPKFNSRDKRDATGAFIPEAQAFCRRHRSSPPELFDNGVPMSERLAFVRSHIEAFPAGYLETLALFCHGWKDGLQIGVRKEQVPQLADSLRAVAAPWLRVVLYCCDAGRDADDERVDDTKPGPGGEGGLADVLRNALRQVGITGTIYAHTTAGHTTRNPWVRRFEPDEIGGGRYIIEPHSALWRPWCRALRGDLRFRYPFMTTEQIERELVGEGEHVA
jgi:hypothetical protein